MNAPRVQGNCPSCLEQHLVVGPGGWIVCLNLDCEVPGAAANLLGPQKVPAGARPPAEELAELRAAVARVRALPPYDKPVYGDRSVGFQMGWDAARAAALSIVNGETA
ncbi:hypothetical protein ACQKFA_23415 [Streptomyces sp. CH6]|uniref:hypothetical protein n=1 Tax=Streptomyces sp. CH6 TaxID=3420320 RepID=UPI003CFBED05